MSTISIANMQQRRLNAIERRPRMLKEFLNENSNSCSSSAFKSFTRKQIPPQTSSSIRSFTQIDLNSRNSIPRNVTMSKLSRSVSSKSAFQTLINAVKSISLYAVKAKSPSILPRSLSRKLSRRNSQKKSQKNGSEIKITVKIKDIIRWKSFQDLAEEQSPPLDLASSTTASTSTTTTTCTSNGSSWTDSDFTASWDGNFVEAAQNDAGGGKKFSPFVGKDPVEATTETTDYMAVGAKEFLTCQDEQQSPLSVLQIEDDEFSSFDQSLANIERKRQKISQTIRRFENLAKLNLVNLEKCQSEDENTDFEEDYDDNNNYNEDERDGEQEERIEDMARMMLHCAKAAHFEQCFKANVDKLLFDFFKDELNARRNQTTNNDGFEWEILRIAENWIEGSFDCDMGLQKDACIDDMNKRARWKKFEEEQEELGLEIESAILDILLWEFADDFSSNQDHF